MQAYHNKEFYIFGKSGACLYGHDLVAKQVTHYNLARPDEPVDKAVIDKQKLLFGLLWSLKGFCERVSPQPLHSTFNNFSTPNYKMHVLEIPTGLKFVLITAPDSPQQVQRDHTKTTLKTIYQSLFVPLVVGNISCEPAKPIRCKLFEAKVQEYLLSNK